LITRYFKNEINEGKIGIMIQIYNKKPIATEIDNNIVYFNAKQVHEALTITWRGKKYLIDKIGIPESQIITKGYNTMGGLQDSTFVSEQAIYMIAFRSNPRKKEAKEYLDKFAIWVSEVIREIRIHGKYEINSPIRIQKNSDVYFQKENSKRLNSKNYIEGGKSQTIEYNTKNMLLHTGKTPVEIKHIGLEKGLKKSECQSAKEVVRKLRPDLAAGISFTDSLVNEDGIDHEKAARISIKYGIPLFHALMEAGVKQERLIDK
jgi:prophage antirepressor-like protein